MTKITGIIYEGQAQIRNYKRIIKNCQKRIAEGFDIEGQENMISAFAKRIATLEEAK